MSKQYLTIHTLDAAHPTDIYSLSPTPTTLLTASGSSSLKVHSTTDASFPLLQTLPNAHKLGCHHVATSSNGLVAASAGFGGEVKVWKMKEDEGAWVAWGTLIEGDGGKERGELWALALDAAGRHLSGSAFDGKVRVWDLSAGPEGWGTPVREYETKGSFGLCVATVRSLLAFVGTCLSEQSANMCRRVKTAGSLLRDTRMAASTSSTTSLDGCFTPCQARSPQSLYSTHPN